MRQPAFVALVTLLVAGGAASSQPPWPPLEPAFEVASVKPSPNDNAPEGISVRPDGSVRFTRFALRTLITMAYRAEGIQRFDQLVGGASWIRVERYDFVLEYSPAFSEPGDAGAGPSLLTDLTEQLGLRLQPE